VVPTLLILRSPVETTRYARVRASRRTADVNVLAVDDQRAKPIRVHVETRVERAACPSCATPAWVKDRPVVELVDLPCFGRPARSVWRKYRWCCPNTTCPVGSWTETNGRIASARLVMTDRAGRG
jgi:transposase